MRRLLIGIGQCGLDVVDNIKHQLSISTAAIDHDKYALHASDADRKILVLEENAVTKTDGLRIDHEVSLESLSEIQRLISSYDRIYIVAALGGRAGGVILPAVVKTAVKLNKQVDGKLILPFEQEESKREIAEMYLDSIRDLFHTLDVYDNNQYVEKADDEITLDSIYSLNSIFEEINRDIRREIQRDIIYEEGR